MRTTIDIPQELFEEAQSILGFKSKSDVVIYSLKEVIRKKKLKELADLAGRVEFEKSAEELRSKHKK
jgi:Arc/MetJ family transcription regulator